MCFPYGGGGASLYSSWEKKLPDFISVFPIQLPGREREIGETPFTDLSIAADYFADYIRTEFQGKDIAFFGHCFLGSVLAFEVINRLKNFGDIRIHHLFVSAAFSPSSVRDYQIDLEKDDEFISKVEKLTGQKNEAFAIPELKELLLPTFKADFKMDIEYFPNESSIDIPITGIYATSDMFVSQKDVKQWGNHSTKDFDLFEVDGEHMYIMENQESVLNVIQNKLNTKVVEEIE
nr:thioesterase domain-containing protein [Enterococcus plantarum]